MFRLLLLTVSLLGSARSDSLVVNQLVDTVLAGIRQEVTAKDMDSIPIPDMSNQWKYKWHHLHLHGDVKCVGGWVKSLTSLQRTGDVVLTTEGNRMTLKMALGLGHLEVGFHHCRFHAKHLFEMTQKISAQVSSNSVVAQATATWQATGTCSVSLDSLQLTNIGQIKVNTGGGPIHKIEDHLLDIFAKHIHDKVVKNLSDSLQDLARRHLQEAGGKLCNWLPH